jgi:anthranilate/para-aminobenzoate synthase component II
MPYLIIPLVSFLAGMTNAIADGGCAGRLMHGKTDMIHHDGETIYVGMLNPCMATRVALLALLAMVLMPQNHYN